MEVAVGSARGGLVRCHLSGELESASRGRSSSTVALRREFQRLQKCQWRLAKLPSCEFLDQSHVQFYGEPDVDRNGLIKKKFSRKLGSLVKEHQSLAACGLTVTESKKDATLVQETSFIVQQDLPKDLADLKARMKEKKKLLKAQKKALKKVLKAKNSKLTTAKASSSSSSSSESSDCDRETVDMEALRGSRMEEKDAGAVPSAAQQEEVVLTFLGQPTCRIDENFDNSLLLSSLPRWKDDSLPSGGLATRADKLGAQIEVCVGGKCKRAGAHQLLASLQESIPSDANVQAVSCKCMGKCGMSINVRVAKQDTNPQHHCHVAAGDAETLLRHHFGIVAPPSNMPHFGKLPPELHRLSCQDLALTTV